MQAKSWIEACNADDIEDEDVVRFDLGDRSFAIYKLSGTYYATEGYCTHQREHLADGLVMDDSCTSDEEGNGNAVYVYLGHDAVPDDLGSAGEPITTAPVSRNDAMAGAYSYTVPFLDPGQYTVAFTCQALDDHPETDETDEDEVA